MNLVLICNTMKNLIYKKEEEEEEKEEEAEEW